MASIDKLGEGRGYKVRWREQGRARSKTVATFSEARALRAAIEAGGAAPQHADHGARPSGAAPTWDEALIAHMGELTVSCKASTLEGRAYELARFARWAQGQGIGPLDLHAGVIAAFYEHLRTTPGRSGARRPSTVVQATRLADGFARWVAAAADDLGWPKPRGLRKLRLPRASRAVCRAPTLAQVDAMTAQLAARALASPCPGAVGAYRVAVIQRWTGARVGEVASACWGDVDLSAGEWVIPTSKTGLGRAVPLHPELLARLVTWAESDTSAPIVGCHVEPTGRSRRFAQAWAEAGVERSVWELRTSHAIRRAVRTHLAAAGVPDELRDVLLGHGRGVVSRYEDLRSIWSRLVEAVETLGAASVAWRVSSRG